MALPEHALEKIWNCLRTRFPTQTTLTIDNFVEVMGTWRNTDYYDVLELQPTATARQISRNFKLLAQKLHPDTTKFEVEFAKVKFQMISDVGGSRCE